MTAGDIEAIRRLIQTAPLTADIRAIVADHFAYSLAESNPRLIRDPFAWKRACARDIAGESFPAGSPMAEAREAERRAFGLESGK